MYATLVPAYGRKVTSGKAAKADWQDGKDWRIAGGPYCSVRDVDTLKASGYTHVELTDGASCKAVIKL